MRGSATAERRVSAAFAAVERAGFLPPDQRRYAAVDQALPLGYGVTNSQPSTVRAMLTLLDVEPGDRVLDVGCGSGWSTALLAHLAGPHGHVVGVELIPEVLAMARAALGRSRRVELHQADPAVLGWPASAPYDRVLVSADADVLPPALVGQLRRGGVLVGPVAGDMLRVERHGRYVFVPLRTLDR
ncbi:protein-L-isoaspartate O-methyltransferase family protein [Nocardioides sp. BYT-33-1]|uniref:protein-L-isoaspartate O-methyltransferase family protein n=1 Tax=Nocardioides sp. BYT-33-1 TaxID=3416952 RepID=UPI003F530E22